MRLQRMRIETGSKDTVGTGGSAWTPESSIIRWAQVVLIPVESRDRYKSLDRVVHYKFTFRGTPAITMQNTRIVWLTDAHPNELKIYEPVSSAADIGGMGRYTTVLVNETGEVAES